MLNNVKKILVISNMYPSVSDPYYGTFVKVFYEYLCRMSSLNVSLIAIRGRRNFIINKIIAYIKFYTSILFAVSLKKYDLIYVHTITHPTPPLRMVSMFKELKMIYNIHGDDLLTTTFLARRLLDFSVPILRDALAIVVPSEYFKEVLLKEMPFLRNKKIIISPSGGVADSFFSKSYSENKIPVIGYVSRIDEGKGWNVLVESLSILQAMGVEFKAFFYGRGEQEEQLLSQISQLRLTNTTFFEGPKSHAELVTIYKTFDVFVFPTIRRGESLGLVGLEAMASSVPVIGSRIGGLNTYIRDNINGFLFSAGDSKALAEKIEHYFLLDETVKNKIRESAFETAKQYESSIVNERLCDEIKHILDCRKF